MEDKSTNIIAVGLVIGLAGMLAIQVSFRFLDHAYPITTLIMLIWGIFLGYLMDWGIKYHKKALHFSREGDPK